MEQNGSSGANQNNKSTTLDNVTSPVTFADIAVKQAPDDQLSIPTPSPKTFAERDNNIVESQVINETSDKGLDKALSEVNKEVKAESTPKKSSTKPIAIITIACLIVAGLSVAAFFAFHSS